MISVGGRLRRASLAYASRHQIILPKQSHLTHLIIRETHEDVKHFGVNYVLNEVRSKYWPVQGRVMVKKALRSCVICKRLRGVPQEQLMADLPASRVEGYEGTFKFTGVDLFGPIITKARYRGGQREKRYGVLFNCLQTRAIHIELAYSQSTDDFFEAPHIGGVWESLVKLAKRAVTAATKGAELTDEELMTVPTECEAMLNNRPLTYISNDPNDLEPLTPAPFLNNKPTTFMLQHELKSEHNSWKKRWLHCQNVVNRWQKEYLLLYNKDQNGTRERGTSRKMTLFLS